MDIMADTWENGRMVGWSVLREMAVEDLPSDLGAHVAVLVGRPLTAEEVGFFAAFAEAAIDSARSLYAAPRYGP